MNRSRLESRNSLLPLATLLLSVAGCADGPEAKAGGETGKVGLELRSSNGAYELSGAIRFDRAGSPSYSRTESLDGPEHATLLSLPVGNYDVTLEEGFRLTHGENGTYAEVTHLVAAVGIAPDPVEVSANTLETVTVSFELDDGSVVVFGSGAAVVVLDVDDAELTCGCAPGLVCVEEAGAPGCRTPCDPALGPEQQCGGAECRLLYRATETGALEPLHLCGALP